MGRLPPSQAWRGGGPRWWRRRRGYVLGPLAIGLALCALGLLAGVVHQHNQAAFLAQAVRTRAVIARIYYGAPAQNYDAPTFDQYAIVHFEAGPQTAHARVLLAANCQGTCPSVYRVGEALTVDYSPENLTYAQLPSRSQGISVDLWYVIVFEVLGVMLLVAAVINMVTG